MRVVLIAVTHGLHRELAVPSGDLLIHAGDFTLYSKPPYIISDFNGWLGGLPHRHKVVVPGNDEFALEGPHDRGVISEAIDGLPRLTFMEAPFARRSPKGSSEREAADRFRVRRQSTSAPAQRVLHITRRGRGRNVKLPRRELFVLLIWEGQFENDAADIGFEGTVNFSGRPACIVSGFQPHAEGLVVNPTAHYEDLFGIFVPLSTIRGCVRTRMESRQPSVFAGLFVDAQCLFLGDTFQTLNRLPSLAAFRA